MIMASYDKDARIEILRKDLVSAEEDARIARERAQPLEQLGILASCEDAPEAMAPFKTLYKSTKLQFAEVQSQHDELQNKFDAASRSLEVLRSRSSHDETSVELNQLRDCVRHHELAIKELVQ